MTDDAEEHSKSVGHEADISTSRELTSESVKSFSKDEEMEVFSADMLG